MTRRDQFGRRLAFNMNEFAIERDAFIASEQVRSGADQPVSSSERRRNPHDLETAWLAFSHPSTEMPEGFEEERSHELRLYPACLSPIELRPNLLDIGGAERIARKRSLLNQPLDSLPCGRVHDLVELRANLGPIAL